MGLGVYGSRVNANITPNDVDIFYSYRANLNTDNATSAQINKISSNILTKCYTTQDDGNTIDTLVEGLYNLKLPLDVFNQKGFYQVLITPKEIPMKITDIGVLSTQSSIKGVVVDITTAPQEVYGAFQTNNELVGWRIEYFDDNNERQDFYRLITSSNKVEPVVQNISDTSSKSVRYRFNDNSNLLFITVTPTTAASFKPSTSPYIGMVGQKIVFKNTKFNPILLDIELVENDADTIATYLTGSQKRDLDNGIVSTFNKNGEIVTQSEYYTVKNSYNGEPVYDVRKLKDSIDYTQTIDGI
jgi:hypothetical protein